MDEPLPLGPQGHLYLYAPALWQLRRFLCRRNQFNEFCGMNISCTLNAAGGNHAPRAWQEFSHQRGLIFFGSRRLRAAALSFFGHHLRAAFSFSPSLPLGSPLCGRWLAHPLNEHILINSFFNVKACCLNWAPLANIFLQTDRTYSERLTKVRLCSFTPLDQVII